LCSSGQRRDGGADVPADPVPVGEADVEDRDVGAQGRDPDQRLRDGARLADDRDIVLALEQVGDPAPDDLVVVEQEHGDRHGGAPSDQVGHGRR
jgi:hypothetical protein